MHLSELCLLDRIRVQRILKYQDKICLARLTHNVNMSLKIIRYLRANGFEDQLTGSDMSFSPHLTIEFIKENSFLDWDWQRLSCIVARKDSVITIDDVLRNKHLPWDPFHISNASTITIDHILTHSDFKWDFKSLSRSLTFCDIEQYPELPWDIEMLSSNPTLDLNYVLNNVELGWNYLMIITYNQRLDIILHDFETWCSKSALNLSFLNDTIAGRYCTSNKHVTMNIVKAHPNIQWEYMTLYQKIPLNDIIHYPNLSLNTYYFGFLSWNASLTLDFVLSNPFVNWFWMGVTSNVLFDFEQLENHNYLPWEWEYIGKNLSFLHVSEQELEQTAKRLFASNKIKRKFKEAISNPSFSICKRRLAKEFSEMS